MSQEESGSVVILPAARGNAAEEHDFIKIILRDMIVQLRVGVHPPERDAPQRVKISVEMQAELPHHYHDISEKKLDRVINYESLRAFLRNELPQHAHIPLLESAAEIIIAHCFEDPRVQNVRVRLEKLDIFPDVAGVGIEMMRYRAA